MKDFLSDVELVKANINVVREATKKITDINQRVIMATTNEKEQDESNELTPIITSTNKKATIAKKLLQALRDNTEQMKKSKNTQQSETRIRENLINTLTRKFVDVMKEYQSAQTKYKTDIKKKVKRQVQIVKPDATSEEIDAVLKSGGGSGEVFKAAILKVSISIIMFNKHSTSLKRYYCNVL